MNSYKSDFANFFKKNNKLIESIAPAITDHRKFCEKLWEFQHSLQLFHNLGLSIAKLKFQVARFSPKFIIFNRPKNIS